MQALIQKTIFTQSGEKTISIHACDIRDLDVDVDIMTVSSFYRDYTNVRGTLFGALADQNIDISSMAPDPEIDLRKQCNIWLSKETSDEALLPIKRIGCIETSPYYAGRNGMKKKEEMMLASIQAYFRMLEIASIMGISVEQIVMPALGTGNQQISADLVITPLLNECIRFLKNNGTSKHIMIVTHNHAIAFKFAMALENSYSFRNEAEISKKIDVEKTRNRMAFISYSSKDKNIADNLCAKLESRGIKVWYAPRDIVSGDYAGAIVEAINRCTHFIVILSQNCAKSNHVLNEVDLAFSQIQRGMVLLPLKIDEEEMGPSFLYYLSRQHWMDAHIPPLEKRLEEFVERCSS